MYRTATDGPIRTQASTSSGRVYVHRAGLLVHLNGRPGIGKSTLAALHADRVTVLHRAQSQGVGPTRNAGITQARGEYLLFLDADDNFFDDHALADLDADLRATGDPDVLLVAYEESRPCGLHRRLGPERDVPFDGTRLITVAERPAALRASWVCWNKAYRRQFVTTAGLWFAPGYYEDFACSIRAMLAAERIAVSGRVRVRYRKCRAGSNSRGVTARQLKVFDQFERVIAFLAAHPSTTPPRPATSSPAAHERSCAAAPDVSE